MKKITFEDLRKSNELRKEVLKLISKDGDYRKFEDQDGNFYYEDGADFYSEFSDDGVAIEELLKNG
jgi:hypothetical protein